VRFQKIYHPNAGAKQAYEELYAVFTRACAELGDTFRRLSDSGGVRPAAGE